jgi:hypothetical protein
MIEQTKMRRSDHTVDVAAAIGAIFFAWLKGIPSGKEWSTAQMKDMYQRASVPKLRSLLPASVMRSAILSCRGVGDDAL